jgi:ankyrin repeat protein
MTALIWSNQIEVSSLLLKEGANINYASEYGHTPLSRAIILNNLPLVEFLIEHGADVNQRNRGDTPLSHAVDENDIKLIKLLLDRGANPSLADHNGWTLFLGIAASNKLEIVKLFLDYVDRDAINQAYDTAVLLGHSELENILKQAGADYFDKEKLFDEAVKSISIKTVRRLLNEGMDTYLKTDKGSDNLIRVFGSSIILSQENYELMYELMRLLIDNGANVNDIVKFSDNLDTYTPPLIYAMDVYGESFNLVSILLEYRANVNARNNAEETALYKAIAKPLVSGCENWIWTTSKDKPAHEKCTEDSLKTIKMLLDHGANIDIETKNGSIKDLISEMKQNEREFVVYFANEVELLLDLYR